MSTTTTKRKTEASYKYTESSMLSFGWLHCTIFNVRVLVSHSFSRSSLRFFVVIRRRKMCLCINLSAVTQHRLQYTHTIPFVTFRWLARSFMSFESKTWTIKRKCRENCTRNGKQNNKKKMGKKHYEMDRDRETRERNARFSSFFRRKWIAGKAHTHTHTYSPSREK